MSDEDPGLGLVTLASVATEIEAESMRMVLEDDGIEAWVFATPIGTLGFGASASCVGGIPVQVRLRDLDRAHRVLRQNADSSGSLDWDTVDVGGDDAEVAAAASLSPTITRVAQILIRIGAVSALLMLALGLVAGVVRLVELVTGPDR